MDPLDAALAQTRVHGSMVGRSLVDPPWSLALDSVRAPCLLAAVERGSAELEYGDRRHRLAAGTVAIACGGHRLLVADPPGTPPDLVISDADTCIETATGTNAIDLQRLGERTWGRADAVTGIVLAAYSTEGALFDELASGLPDLLIVDDPAVRPLLDVIALETVAARPGSQVVVDRLMELLLFTAVRAWLATAAPVPTWAHALSDPVAGPALRAMHAEPAAGWTVESLAATAAVSRSSFARQFRLAVGESPLAHLTRWRMALAADRLNSTTDGIGAVAAAVGYADAFSFSTAFRRVRGVPPSALRRRAG